MDTLLLLFEHRIWAQFELSEEDFTRYKIYMLINLSDALLRNHYDASENEATVIWKKLSNLKYSKLDHWKLKMK